MTVRRPEYQLLNADYEVFEDDESDTLVGVAQVRGGVIQILKARDEGDAEYDGQVLSALLGAIVDEADRINSNLSMKAPPTETSRLKRFLERFGFRNTNGLIFKRAAGSIRPTSVMY